jgi:integrase
MSYDIRTVQDLLGHKRTAMIYARVLHQERRGAQSPVDLL